MTTFAVSKVELDPGERAMALPWGRVDSGKDTGCKTLVLDGRTAYGRDVHDMELLYGSAPR